MNDRQSPLDQVLDLVVFAPLGLAVTIAEELPQMAEKGRARLSQRTSVARMVGQLAVAEGRRRLGVNPPGAMSAAAGGSASAGGSAAGGSDAAGAGGSAPAGAGGSAPAAGGSAPAGAGGGATTTSARSAPTGRLTGSSRTATGPDRRPAGGGQGGVTAEPSSGAAPIDGTPRPSSDGAGGETGRSAAEKGQAPVSGDLAIPGYDSLSASQVVQRLASLSPAELDAVRRYEAANRGRRTILARVTQLQQG
jgi:hypothetical protein